MTKRTHSDPAGLRILKLWHELTELINEDGYEGLMLYAKRTDDRHTISLRMEDCDSEIEIRVHPAKTTVLGELRNRCPWCPQPPDTITVSSVPLA